MKLNRFRTKIAAVLALTLISGVGLAVPATAANTRYITISATGTTTVVPDAVRINATVSVLGASSKEALGTASTTAAAMRTALADNKVATKDIATQSINVYPEYTYPTTGNPVISGYRASQSFVITVRATATAGAVVDSIVAAGGDNLQINGVSPYVINSSGATDKARNYAVSRARAKATSYAKLLGIKLGKVIYLDESSTPTAYPIYSSMAKADGAPTTVDLGQQKITVSVTVRWAIG